MLRNVLASRLPPKRQATQTAASAKSDHSRLLHCLLDEVRTSLVLTGVTTSTLNAIPHHPQLLAWAGAFIPSDPIIFPSVKVNLIEGIDPSRLQYTTHFYRHLPIAKLSLNAYLGDTDERTLLHVCDNWRSLCGVAESAMKEVDRYLGQHDDEELHLSDDIRRLLIAARSANSPCLINGRPAMPAWFQRRHNPRILANLMAHLSYGQLTAPVRIINVSIGGCGIDQSPTLPPEAIVDLRLESGRVLESVVRWQNGSRAGLLFSTPLGYRDPLISAG